MYTGSTHRYTIQPLFPSLSSSRRFRCHLEHRHDPVLYRLFFYAQLPSLATPPTQATPPSLATRPSIVTAPSPVTLPSLPRVTVSIPSGNISFQQHGFYSADFLTIEHNAGLELEEEVILSGREMGDHRAGGGMEYTVSSAVLTHDRVCTLRYSIHRVRGGRMDHSIGGGMNHRVGGGIL